MITCVLIPLIGPLFIWSLNLSKAYKTVPNVCLLLKMLPFYILTDEAISYSFTKVTMKSVQETSSWLSSSWSYAVSYKVLNVSPISFLKTPLFLQGRLNSFLSWQLLHSYEVTQVTLNCSLFFFWPRYFFGSRGHCCFELIGCFGEGWLLEFLPYSHTFITDKWMFGPYIRRKKREKVTIKK